MTLGQDVCLTWARSRGGATRTAFPEYPLGRTVDLWEPHHSGLAVHDREEEDLRRLRSERRCDHNARWSTGTLRLMRDPTPAPPPSLNPAAGRLGAGIQTPKMKIPAKMRFQVERVRGSKWTAKVTLHA